MSDDYEKAIVDAMRECDATRKEATIGLLACVIANKDPDFANELFASLAVVLARARGEPVYAFLRREANDAEADLSPDTAPS